MCRRAWPAGTVAGCPDRDLDLTGYELVIDEDFDGAGLDTARWFPHYLPHWSSRAATAARYGIRDSQLRLRIDDDQPPWAPDLDGGTRVSAVQSGVFAGPVGSDIGQHRFRDGLVVREAQESRALITPTYGVFEVVASALSRPDAMVAFWMIGYEDRPERSAEVCVMEIFGREVRPGRALNGMGVHPFHDPSISDDFAKVELALDVRDPHAYAVEWTPERCRFFVDRRHLRTVEQSPAYPMQTMLTIYAFDEPAPAHAEPLVFPIDRFRVWQRPTGRQAVGGVSRRCRSTSIVNVRIRSPSSRYTRRNASSRCSLRAVGRGRVVVRPVERVLDTREDRARLLRLVAQRDHVVEPLAAGSRSRDFEAKPVARAAPASARTRRVSGFTPFGAEPADVRPRTPSPPMLPQQRLGHDRARRVAHAHEQHADRAAGAARDPAGTSAHGRASRWSWVQVLDLARGQEHDVLGDVRDAVADPLEVVRREHDPRAPVHVRRVLAHQLQHVVEDPVVEVVDLVVQGRDLAGRDHVDVDQRADDPLDQLGGALAQDAAGPRSCLSGGWGASLRPCLATEPAWSPIRSSS